MLDRLFHRNKPADTNALAPHDKIDKPTPVGDELEKLLRYGASAVKFRAERDATIVDGQVINYDGYDQADQLRSENERLENVSAKKLKRMLGKRGFRKAQADFEGSITGEYVSPDELAAAQAAALRAQAKSAKVLR